MREADAQRIAVWLLVALERAGSAASSSSVGGKEESEGASADDAGAEDKLGEASATRVEGVGKRKHPVSGLEADDQVKICCI